MENTKIIQGSFEVSALCQCSGNHSSVRFLLLSIVLNSDCLFRVEERGGEDRNQRLAALLLALKSS